MADTPSTPVKCKEKVSDRSGWHFRRCSFNAVRDGYCTKHHPDYKKARRDKELVRDIKRAVDNEARNYRGIVRMLECHGETTLPSQDVFLERVRKYLLSERNCFASLQRYYDPETQQPCAPCRGNGERRVEVGNDSRWGTCPDGKGRGYTEKD